MLISIGEEREHFGYDAIRDKYISEKHKPLSIDDIKRAFNKADEQSDNDKNQR